MSPCMRSITITAILSAALAFGAVAASGQELPSPPAGQSVLGQRSLQDLLRGLSRHVGARRRPVGGKHEEAAARSDTVCREERRHVPVRAGRPDHRWTPAGKGPWWSRHAGLGRRVQGVKPGSSEESVQARIKALVEYLERIQERRAP